MNNSSYVISRRYKHIYRSHYESKLRLCRTTSIRGEEFYVDEEPCDVSLPEYNEGKRYLLGLLGIPEEYQDSFIQHHYRNFQYRVLDRITTGTTLDDLKQWIRYDTDILTYRNGLHDIICPPTIRFERACDNNNPNTFDFVRVSFNLVRKGRTNNEIKHILRENKDRVDQLIVTTIRKHMPKKCVVPINCLRVTGCVITRDNRLVYTLELKLVK